MSRLLAFLALVLLGGCEWSAKAPLLTRADYASPAIDGEYAMHGPDKDGRARIQRQADGGIRVASYDEETKRWDTDAGVVHLKAIRGEYYLVESPGAFGGMSYVIAQLHGDQISVWLTSCTALKGRPGVSQDCVFANRATLLAAAKAAVDSLEKSYIYPVPTITFVREASGG